MFLEVLDLVTKLDVEIQHSNCHSGFSKSHAEIVAAAKNHTAVEEDEDSPHQQSQVEDPKLDMTPSAVEKDEDSLRQKY